MSRVSLIADAHPDAGLGHLSRSSALAAAIVALDVPIRALGLGAEARVERYGVEWTPAGDDEIEGLDDEVVVLDSYRLRAEVVARLIARHKVVLMHDDGEVPPGIALCVGGERSLQDACLGPPFWADEHRPVADRVDRVLVTTGAGDPRGMLRRLATDLTAALPVATVRAVAGPAVAVWAAPRTEVVRAPSGLAEELRAADLVVCAGGQTLLEAAALGRPSIALVLAENQRNQVEALAAEGGVLTASDIAAAVTLASALAGDRVARRELAVAARRAVDGRGALRVAERVRALRTRSVPPPRTTTSRA